MSEGQLIRKFDHLFELVEKPEFINRQMIGGDIPFYIFSYDIKDQSTMDEQIIALRRRIAQAGMNVQRINLYEEAIEVINSYSSVEKLMKYEAKLNADKFRKAMYSTLDLQQRFVPHIVTKVEAQKPQILLLHGVNSIYPIIRANELLNLLSDALHNISTIVFYPGTYTSKRLKLFDLLEDNKYYRAHPISDLKI